MSIPLSQEYDGQLSLFGGNNDSIIIRDQYEMLMDNITRGIKVFQRDIETIRSLEKD